MKESLCISTLLEPLMQQFKPESMLLAGELAQAISIPQDTRLQSLTTPFNTAQLSTIQPVNLAIVSDLTETLAVSEGQQWLGLLRNLYAPHIILISDAEMTAQQGWRLEDYLAIGLKRVTEHAQGIQLYRYAIENYQFKRDWLNSRFWANPENFGKYWW